MKTLQRLTDWLARGCALAAALVVIVGPVGPVRRHAAALFVLAGAGALAPDRKSTPAGVLPAFNTRRQPMEREQRESAAPGQPGKQVRVTLAQWLQHGGEGAPMVGSSVTCADCLQQFEVSEQSAMVIRPAHADAVVVCPGCGALYDAGELAPREPAPAAAVASEVAHTTGQSPAPVPAVPAETPALAEGGPTVVAQTAAKPEPTVVGLAVAAFDLQAVELERLVEVMTQTRRFLDQVQAEFARRHGHGTQAGGSASA